MRQIRQWLVVVWPLVGLTVIFLFLPGNSYYERLSPRPAPALAAVDYSLPDLPPIWQQRFDFPPAAEAEAVLLQDVESGQLLYAKNYRRRLSPASVTKIMSAIVVLEEMGWEEIVTVSEPEHYGQIVGLQSGDKFPVRELLRAMVVMSANDAAYALADAYPGGRQAFVGRMNQKAKELGLADSRFANPNGQPHPQHYSTAWDLARLTQYTYKKDRFRQLIGTAAGRICSLSGTCYPIATTNELLHYFPGIKGVKTGWTEQAGECFIAWWQYEDRELVSVILNSTDRFGETENLLGWGKVNFYPNEIEFDRP